jgi:hypothetical protein
VFSIPNWPCSRSMSAHDGPSTYSMTMKWRVEGSSSPESNTCTMFGCCSRAAASASRLKRATNASSSDRCSASSFTATGRSSTLSRARKTVDMPPAPRRPSRT